MAHTKSSSTGTAIHLPGRPTLSGMTWLRSQKDTPPYTRGRTRTPLANHCPPTFNPFRLMIWYHQRRKWRQRSDTSFLTRQAATPTSTRSTSICGTGGLYARGSNPPPKSGMWIELVGIFKYMWSTRDIPRELEGDIMVLIPKENTDTRGISLLETL